jgi:hypothetical protein
MAWNDVTYACGHVCRIQLYGKIKSRDSYVEWASTGRDCPDCVKKEKEEARKRELESAKKEAEKEGLPALEGSPKQTAWAESIRIKMLEELYILVGKMTQHMEKVKKINPNPSDELKEKIENQMELIEYIKTETRIRKEWTKAKDFIDSRYTYSESYFEKKLKEKKMKEFGKEELNK